MTEVAFTDASGNVRLRGTLEPPPGEAQTLDAVLTEGNDGGSVGMSNTGTIGMGSGDLNTEGGSIDTGSGTVTALGVLVTDGSSSAVTDPGEITLTSANAGVSLLATSATRAVSVLAPAHGTGIRIAPKTGGGGNVPDGALDLAGVPFLIAANRPEVPATPLPQDIVDALVTLGIFTQAS